MKKIIVFDTTLRDGEQVPGAKLNTPQKVEIAGRLAELGVDVIEAGFPASSPGDAEAVAAVARAVHGPVVAGLARAVAADIDAVWDAVRHAARPRIHIVLGSSDIHIRDKFARDREAVLEIAIAAVKHARRLTTDVEYSPEDAGRSDPDYLCRVIEAVIHAGASVVNLADTVGWAVPEQFGMLVRSVRERVPAFDRAALSVHCHNDCGLATANTLAAVKNGADQVEVTINGLGERAGNAALEEVVMGIAVRPDYYQAVTNIQHERITETSRLVEKLTGVPVQPNKAVVGTNAFAHSSGIHQDGILKSRHTYQIIAPEDVGATAHRFVLTARSGRHAVRHVLGQAGIELAPEPFEKLFGRFLALADRQKEVRPDELAALVR
jgi:2-isopropylmalate synthase